MEQVTNQTLPAPSDRDIRINELKQLITLAEAHPLIQIPDTLTFPLTVGVTQPVRKRKAREALGTKPLTSKPK